MSVKNKKKGIYCLEGLWNHHDIKDKSTVLPILDLLEKRNYCDYIYHDCATKDELEFFLDKWKNKSVSNKYPILYLALLHDRKNQGLCVVYSTKGGMDIEEVAKEDPNAIKVHSFDIKKGLTKEAAAKIIDELQIPAGKMRDQGIDQLQKLYQMFLKLDAT